MQGMQRAARLLKRFYVVGLAVMWAGNIVLIIMGRATPMMILNDVALTVVILVFGKLLVGEADSLAKPEQKP